MTIHSDSAAELWHQIVSATQNEQEHAPGFTGFIFCWRLIGTHELIFASRWVVVQFDVSWESYQSPRLPNFAHQVQ